MFTPKRIDRALRLLVLAALLAAMTFVPQAVLAQSTRLPPGSVSIRPDAGQVPNPAAQPDQPHWTTQEVLNQMGIVRPSTPNMTHFSQQVADWVKANGLPASATAPKQPQVGGLPNDLYGSAALSAAILTTLNSSGGTNFRDVMAMADADGREDLVADHGAKIDDLSTSSLPGSWLLTRAAISEHTAANGYTNTFYYYGDSVGNVYVGQGGASSYDPKVVTYTVLNLPTIINAFGSLNSDDQIVVTGLAVNPVADLSSFPNVNGSFAPFNKQIGEILYVSFWDTGSGLRLFFNNQPIESGVLAFPISDQPSPAANPPGIQSNPPFPVTVGGSFGVAFSTFANVAGLTVDDEGNVYFQQVDLNTFTGANIVKITSVDQPGLGGFQDRSLATSGFAYINNLNPNNGDYGHASGPAKQSSHLTNYSGTSSAFGNIASLAAGPDNILYAAVARSYVAGDSSDVRKTEGLFTNPAALGPTPSMIISFADTTGAFDKCSAPDATLSGSIPVADGLADVAQKGLSLVPGVNNFRAFVLGDGPDVRGALLGATAANTLKLQFQVDDTVYSGLAVDEESKVYVISGGTPAGVGRDPSPNLGEILVFPDLQPLDRRADFIDLRGDSVPQPFDLTNNLGDGQSDRYDHIFYEAPLDQISLTPVGLSGLARGFLFYLNRTHDTMLGSSLPNGHPLGDDVAVGPIPFESLDASHQIAGGDDQTFPYRGDDSDGAGKPALAGPLMGGFEFVYREYLTTTHKLVTTAWNAFYWNSNGSISFGSGDTANIATVSGFVNGAPKIAAAWTDLNPGSRVNYSNTFPVQALGFANINHFVVRSIDVPEFGYEHCNSSNNFTINLYDSGTGIDLNSNQPLNPANPIGNNAVPFDLHQGPTDWRYFTVGAQLAGAHPRPAGSGTICLDYGRMDLLGSNTLGDETLVGVTPGHQPTTTLGLALNLSQVALAGDAPFPAEQGIGFGPQLPAAPYEFFTAGVPASYTVNLIVSPTITTTIPAIPAYDLRWQGNDSAESTPVNQSDLNRGQVCFYDDFNALFLPLTLKSS